MKTTLILAAILTFGTLAVAPTGQAHVIPYRDLETCVTVYDFPDLGWKVCANPQDPSCTVYEYRTTIVGTEKTCIYPGPSQAASSAGIDGGIPWPGGSTPDFQCMDVYSETRIEGTNYWLVRRDSCSAQLYECPEGYNPPAPPCQEAQIFSTSASSTAACYMVYTRNNVGTYSVVRRTSCSPPEVYECPYENAPISQCRNLLELTSAAAVQVPQPPPMNCYDIYSRREVGPVAVVMTSSCSGHIEVCDKRVDLERKVDLSCADDLVAIQCMPYYNEREVGPVTVRQGGCGSSVLLCDYNVLGGIDASCVLAPTTASQEPMCMYYYRETEVGPVRHVQRDSCHSETYVCDEDAAAYLTSKPDPNGFVQCTWDSTGLVGPVIW